MAQLNALMAIKAVTGKLPVNIVFVAEGDEERMDVGVRKFVKDHPDFFKNVDALIGEAGQQSPSGGGSVGGGSEGCVYFELTTSGSRGAAAGAVGHPWFEQTLGGQPGVAPHEDAGVAGV